MPFGFNPEDTPPFTPGTGLPVVPTDPGTGSGGTTTPPPTTTVTVVDAYTKTQCDNTFQAKADFPRWNRINTIPVATADYSVYDGFDTLGLAVSNFAFWALNSLSRQDPSLKINGAIPFYSRLLFSGKGSNLPEYGILWIKNNNMANYLGFQRSSTQSINYSVAHKKRDGTVKWYHFEDPHSDANNKLVLSNGTTSSQWWVADGTNGKPALRLIADGFLQVTTRGKRWIIEGDIEGVYDVPYLTTVQLTNVGTGGAAQVDGTVGIRALKAGMGLSIFYDGSSKCNTVKLNFAVTDLLNLLSTPIPLGSWSFGIRGFYDLCYCMTYGIVYYMPNNDTHPKDIALCFLGFDLGNWKTMVDRPTSRAIYCHTTDRECCFNVAVPKDSTYRVNFKNNAGDLLADHYYDGGGKSLNIPVASNGKRYIIQTAKIFSITFGTELITVQGPIVLSNFLSGNAVEYT